VKIVLLIEGDTERAFLPHLRRFLQSRLPGKMPRLDAMPYHGSIPAGDRLRRDVGRLLEVGRQPADAVIALTDVYTGSPLFKDAADARRKLSDWAGRNPRFFPHAAQYDFEAWLIPYWPEIQRLAGTNRAAPSPSPETINHLKPPSALIREVFRTGNRNRDYVKPRDASRILENQDLTVAAAACPELRAFLNTILALCGAPTI
jgi:hypothetical protein